MRITRIPLPLIVAVVVGVTATLYMTLHVIPHPFVPTMPSNVITLNLTEQKWVIVGPIYGQIIGVRSDTPVDVILGEASAVAAYLPAMPFDHLSYEGFGGRYHVINKSGIYAIVANEVCFAGKAIKLPNGVIAIMPGPIFETNLTTYLSICNVEDGVGLWNGRIDVIDASQPPTMVFYLYGGGMAVGVSYRYQYGRWQFEEQYFSNTTYVDVVRGPPPDMYGTYWNGTMFYYLLDKVAWVAVKPRYEAAHVRIIITQ